MSIFWLILGLVIGAPVGLAIGWLICERRLRQSHAQTQTELALASQRQLDAEASLQNQQSELVQLRNQVSELQQQRASLDAQLAAERKSLIEQKQQMSESIAKLREAFAELSVQALDHNSRQFFTLAEQKFNTLQAQAAGAFDQKRAEMQQLLTPMQQVLDQYKTKLDQIEKARGDAYTSISQQLAAVAATQQNLSKETTQLVQALRRPQTRGRWGELTLKRLFEMAGMAEHVSFVEQVSVTTDEGRKRPDCIVHLPEDRQVIIDSKCVIDAFLDASSAPDEPTRLSHLARHAQQVRSRVVDLSTKAYWESFDRATDYVVLFLPGEAFLYAAVEQDPTLIEDALSQRVIIASPTTLLGLLRVIEHAWRQTQLEANATEVRELGGVLYERLVKMAAHFQRLGESINKTGEAYNKAIGSLERSVLPAARRMAEMGVGDGKLVLEEMTDAAPQPRELSSKSWPSLTESAS